MADDLQPLRMRKAAISTLLKRNLSMPTRNDLQGKLDALEKPQGGGGRKKKGPKVGPQYPANAFTNPGGKMRG